MTREEAIDALVNEFHIGDYVYNVRERVTEDREWFMANPQASSWDHPKVKRFSDAVTALRANKP